MKNFWKKETFFAGSHLIYQYHFEDTPREAVRAIALTASLLFRQLWRFMNLDGPFWGWIPENSAGRLFGRKFRENLIELRNLEDLFHFRRQANDLQLSVSFDH